MTNEAATQAVFRVLSLIEEQTGTGVLGFRREDGSAAGAIVVVDRRMCLVRGVRGIPRFTQLLAERHPQSSKVLAEAVKSARSQGRMIGEVLAELGRFPMSQIRETLRDQVAMCVVGLARLFDSNSPPHWMPLTGGFDAQLTFSPREMFEVAIRQLRPVRDVDFACAMYQHYRTDAAFSLLALRDVRTVLPILVDGVDTPELAHVSQLGRHVRAVAEPATLQSAGIKPRLVSFNSGKEYGVVCVSETHVSMLGGLGAATRGRILREVADWLELHPVPRNA